MIRPTAAVPALAEAPGKGALPRDDGRACGLRCRVCGLDDVPWPRTAYCSERCRRRAAYLARQRRQRRYTAGPQPIADSEKRTKR